jgi:class 3 adenylate cyclase
MAVFPDPSASIDAACSALEAGSGVSVDGYETRLRAGLHFGTPRAIGSDYIGIDVNIAARLCEAARGNEVLLSAAVCDELDGHAPTPAPRPRSQLRGVPSKLETFSVRVEPG